MMTPEDLKAYHEAENKRLNTPVKAGDVLFNSWGYDMTINDFCICLENTGKTLKCQMLGKRVIPRGSLTASEHAVPMPEMKLGEPFRLRITKRKNSPGWWYCGTYPYCISESGEVKDKHRGSFFVWDGKPNYENHDD